jgi:hypothetical protein
LEQAGLPREEEQCHPVEVDFEVWADIQSDTSARHAEMRVIPWVSEGGEGENELSVVRIADHLPSTARFL